MIPTGWYYGFSDSDWGADPDSYRSTGAYIFFLDGAACSWKVKLSSTALLRSQESEYVAGSEATKEALNLRMLLEHLGFGDARPTDIYVDNKGAITMGLHPANKPATRHVNMRCTCFAITSNSDTSPPPAVPLSIWWRIT